MAGGSLSAILIFSSCVAVSAWVFLDGLEPSQQSTITAKAHEAKKFQLDAAVRDGAVCLDGTPPAYYFEPGLGAGKQRWYIHHEGGGWCESLADCAARSLTGLGSSRGYSDTVDLGGAYFSRDSKENPLMYNWNKVMIKYCDGGSFSGNNETITIYENTSLYFRGKRVREAVQAHLLEAQGMGNATDLVVSGCSAGGLATFLHTDQWCDALQITSPRAKCVGLPDSGFFLDYQDPAVRCTPESPVGATVGRLGNTIMGDYHCGLKWTYSQQNASGGVHRGCIRATPLQERWKCMFAKHVAPFIRAPMFALQSQYDSWQTANVQGSGGDAKSQELGNNITMRLVGSLLDHNPASGAFLDSCWHHCGAWNLIRIDGDLVSRAVQRWYNSLGQEGSKRLWNQGQPWKCAACCTP
jgi:hypothetical protein